MLLISSIVIYAQEDVTKFLGIPVDGSKSEMIQKLKAKGYTSSQHNKDILVGEFNGTDVNIHIATNNNKVCRIMVCDANNIDERSIQIRFNKLCEQFKNNSVTYRALVESLRYTEVITVIILLLVLIGNGSLIVMSTRLITEPLKLLAEAANEIAKGNLEIDQIPVQQQDEVGIVTAAFNQMVTSIRTYIEQLRITMERESQLKERELMMQSHLKDAQLKYLQAQINPHFLFNTLNAGAQLAMMEDAAKTEQFLLNVSEFFRYNVRKNNQQVTLGEEVRLVDNYVYILNVRFAGEIHFEKEVDQSLGNVAVPGMILQPLVENAVNYGIRDIDWEGRIELTVCRKDHHISISVWDNGAGMTRERIDQVLTGSIDEEAATDHSNGVGMRNVIERLNLFFHDQAKMEILSEGLNKGTEVVITIPFADEEE